MPIPNYWMETKSIHQLLIEAYGAVVQLAETEELESCRVSQVSLYVYNTESLRNSVQAIELT